MLKLSIPEMDCASEEQQVRAALATLPEPVDAYFDLGRRELTVRHGLGDDSTILRAIEASGMRPRRVVDERSVSRPNRWRYWLLALGGCAALGAEAVVWMGQPEDGPYTVMLALLGIAFTGKEVLEKGLKALVRLRLNINLLMTIAVAGAVAIGKWPEAAVVIWLFAIAELLEALSLDRARRAIRQLLSLAPETASVAMDGGTWEERPVAAVGIGDRVRVLAGMRVPLDGRVRDGRSAVNQSPITGESVPVEKNPDDPVYAGSINGQGVLEIEVTAEADDSTLARIIRAVEGAEGARAPTEQFVDRFARVYIPAIVVIALATALVLPFALSESFAVWSYRALVLLVIACPCALVISTPVTIVSGLAAAARRGILVKGGAHLEAARNLKALAVDKTGTLTRGQPVVTDIVPVATAEPQAAIVMAAALSTRSDHPVSGAIAEHWLANSDGGSMPAVDAVEAIPGRGIQALLDGRRLMLGNHRFIEEANACSPATEAALERLESEGKTTVILARDGAAVAVIAVADLVRETSREAIETLHGLDVRTVMLSGDNPRTAGVVGAVLGIDDVRGGLLPEQKLDAMSELVRNYGTVGMVGDGINDAPALARAGLGFAMGAAGSDTAIETADVALMDDDLRKIPELILLSRRTHAILIQNITIALGIKLVFLLLAVLGRSTLWMAIFADLGASLIVVANGLRLAYGVRSQA
ncbi:MAG: heavy metal translocating P-type ATPase [Burkholderiales bacterium]